MKEVHVVIKLVETLSYWCALGVRQANGALHGLSPCTLISFTCYMCNIVAFSYALSE
jgi:hypothetical protein